VKILAHLPEPGRQRRRAAIPQVQQIAFERNGHDDDGPTVGCSHQSIEGVAGDGLIGLIVVVVERSYPLGQRLGRLNDLIVHHRLIAMDGITVPSRSALLARTTCRR
jgi:hypothetical protein